MSYEGFLTYDGTEFANVSRTVQLAAAMGVTTVRVPESKVAWIDTLNGDPDYSMIANAPWYDPEVPASAEFAGLLVLRVDGLDDSTLTTTPTEYITDGGYAGRPRSSTQPLVLDGRIVASTERGAEFGKRWITRVLSRASSDPLCSGSVLDYFRLSSAEGNERVHRRNVRMSRSISVTRKTRRSCSATWAITFTLLAADPFEYGEEVPRITSLGAGVGSTGPGVAASGTMTGAYVLCPSEPALPLYDPTFPALVSAPHLPDFYPQGWDLTEGDTFARYWARINVPEPDDLRMVPIIRLTTDAEARMVRVSIWPGDVPLDSQCDPLFSAVITYLPADKTLYVDSERQTAYVLDDFGNVQRADSLVYSDAAEPIDWAALAGYDQLLVTLDTFGVPVVYDTTNSITYTFDIDSEGFTADNATAERDTTVHHAGAGSLKMTVIADGDASVSAPAGTAVAVTPGSAYSTTAQIKSVSAGTGYLRLDWLDGGGAVLSSVAGGGTETDDLDWTQISVSASVAPAGAVKARPTAYITEAVTGEVHYVDSITVNEEDAIGGGGVEGGGFVRLALGLMSKSD